LALAMAIRVPSARVWAVDVNPRAVQLTRDNAARLGLPQVRAKAPEDIAPELRFAAIWSNPPIRIGKPELHALLLRWLPRLAPQGQAYLVVQRHLGADSLHSWLIDALGDDFAIDRAGSAKGYRVLHVARTDR
jgi:16S rRNA G1207 methylase RsmC